MVEGACAHTRASAYIHMHTQRDRQTTIDLTIKIQVEIRAGALSIYR